LYVRERSNEREIEKEREGEGRKRDGRKRERERERQTIAYNQLITCYQALREFPFVVFPTLKKTSNNMP
jgi:hypothetical protein